MGLAIVKILYGSGRGIFVFSTTRA